MQAAVPAAAGADAPNDASDLRASYDVANVTGKVRAVGLSNFGADELEALLAMKDLSVRPALVQNGFSAVKAGHPEAGSWGGRDMRAFRKCVAEGITFSAYSPLGEWTKVDVLGDPTVNAIAKAHGKSPAQVALRWLVQQGIVVVTATGSAAHAAGDFQIFDFRLTDAEMAAL